MSAQSERIGAWSMLHDDLEEDLVGADWHQLVIGNLYTSLVDLAARRGWPWHVGNQLALLGWKPDGTRWRPSPDIMVHPQAGPALRDEMAVRADGPPTLVVEVASATTWSYDADMVEGKGAGYLHLGVREYLVFDPTARFLGTFCRGWRRVDGTVHEWTPTAEGRYQSTALGILFQSDGTYPRVFDPEGRPVPYHEELVRETTAQASRIDALAAEITRLQAELERWRGGEAPPADTGQTTAPRS